MDKKVADKGSPERLTQIAPIVRGLLAEATGEQDMPYKPVILKSLTSKEAIDFAGSAKNADALDFPAPLTKGQRPPLFTDAMDLYESRLHELTAEHGPYVRENAVKDYHAHLQGVTTDNMLELTYTERKRIHNLKYFTWIEQQGRDMEELNGQWYDYPNYWYTIQGQVSQIDAHIEEFNQKVGLL